MRGRWRAGTSEIGAVLAMTADSADPREVVMSQLAAQENDSSSSPNDRMSSPLAE